MASLKLDVKLSLIDVYKFVQLNPPDAYCVNAKVNCIGALFKSTYVGDIEQIMTAGGASLVQGR